MHNSSHADGIDHSKSRAYPLMVQGLRTNPNDPECHILCFDIEALVGELKYLIKDEFNYITVFILIIFELQCNC